MSVATLPREPVTVAVGAPLDLVAGPEVAAWRVEAGRIDVFAVVERDGAAMGNRRFVRSAGPGDLLPVAPAARAGVTAVLRGFSGGHAIVRPLDADELAQCGAGAVEAWVGDLSAAVAAAGTQPLSAAVAVAAGEQVDAPAGTALRAGHGVVWLRVEEGEAALFGEGEALGPGALVPLAVAGRVVATTPLSAFAVAPDTAAWPPALARFTAAALDLLARGHAAALAAEDARIAESARASRRVMQGAAANFAQVLGRPSDRLARPSAEDPLTACCRAVAAALRHDAPMRPPSPADPPAGVGERISRCAGMPARELTLYGAWWRDELGPMIGARRETGAPVALLPAGRRAYRLWDPETGVAERIDEATAGTLQATAFSLYPTLPDRALRWRDATRFALRPSRGDLAVLLAMSFAAALLALALPTAIGVLTDALIPSRLKLQLWSLGALLLLVVAAQVVVRVAGETAQLRLFSRAATRLQTALVDRVVRLPSDYLGRFTTSELASRTLVVEQLRRRLAATVMTTLLSVILSLVSIVYLLLLSPAAALVALAGFTLYGVAAAWAGRAQLPGLRAASTRTNQAAQAAHQFIANLTHLRAAGAEERAYARWAEQYGAQQAAELGVARVAARFAAFAAAYEVLAFAALFAALAAGLTVAATTGGAVVVIATYAQFVAASTGIGANLLLLFPLVPKLTGARSLLQETPEADVSKADPGALTGRIEVNHLSFAYRDGAPVLHDLSFTIEPGRMVAFVGPSGCGKSTLMKLLLGFLEPTGGAVFFDGRDLRTIDHRALRRRIGIVLQEGRLMSGSIAENILGVTGGTNDQAWAAARAAGFAADVEAMPMGMHTMVSGDGSTLSGGQVQRLLIARALVAAPRVMFMDEATSALDNRTQAIVTRSIEQMAGTRIVIAHRLSTIANADRIYVLDAGRIVQAGGYAELIAQPGLFADLARRQLTD